jgi:hypothetical protein
MPNKTLQQTAATVIDLPGLDVPAVAAAAELGRSARRRRHRVKMYILVRESVPIGFAILAAAHASIACYLKFRDAPEIAVWLAGPFYKVVCKVTDSEFEAAKEFADNVVLTESALDNVEVAIAFRPREEWPKAFKFYKLYK